MELVDIYYGFSDRIWLDLSASEQLQIWLDYMNDYEEIKDHCINDYTSEGIDWQKVAVERVFVYNDEFVLRMNTVSDLINQISSSFEKKLISYYGRIDNETYIIIYHGLGNAAGRFDTYQSKNAIMFGVEKIVELNWDNQAKLEDLFAHEYTHLVHQEVRGENLEPFQDFFRKNIFRLYTEGLATYAEMIFNGREKIEKNWYESATLVKNQLKKEFLKRLRNHDETCNDFFGDWYPVMGITEAGYFLGSEIIKKIIGDYHISDIMKLEYSEIEKLFLNYLQEDELI